MKKKINRRIIIITGSDSSGKSKLGHLMGSHPDALFSYATTSYHKYFNEKNFVIYENKVEALKDTIERNFYYQNGGYTSDGRKWLKTDKLFFYDFKKISKYLRLQIKKNITISDFYFYWNEALILGRKNGLKTSFTVFEIENVFNIKVINHLTNSNKNLKIINIYRNPLDQIKSLKINILLRGGISKKNGFSGALSGQSNVFNYSIISIIKQYNFLRNKKVAMHLKLNDLKPLRLKTAINLSRYLYNKVDIKFIIFLLKGSRLTNYKNKYFHLRRESQSFRLKIIQKPFNLKYLINKKNISQHMYSYEKFFYLVILKSLTNNNFRSKKFVFLYFQIMSLIFGFSDIRKKLPLKKLVKIRINSFKIVNNTKKLLNKYEFIKN